MARRFVSATDTVRIDLGDGDWVDIKKRLSFGERRRARANMLRTQFDPNLGQLAAFDVDMDAQTEALMLIAIVGWNLEDEKGELVPINADTISMLDEDTGDTILDAINDQYRRRTEEERKN